MDSQGTLKNQNNLEKEKQSWRAHLLTFNLTTKLQ